MNFGMTILSRNVKIKQNYAIWILIALLLILNIETEDFYKDIANDVKRWFDTSNYGKSDKRPLPIGINKKVIGMFKDELGGKMIKNFCGPRAKTYACLIDCYDDDDDDDDDYDKNKIINKKAKGTKKCVIKCTLKFKDYHDSIFENKTILRSQQRFKSNHHNVSTEEVNKIAISINDDKRINIR